jgi:hypothetical protein
MGCHPPRQSSPPPPAHPTSTPRPWRAPGIMCPLRAGAVRIAPGWADLDTEALHLGQQGLRLRERLGDPEPAMLEEHLDHPHQVALGHAPTLGDLVRLGTAGDRDGHQSDSEPRVLEQIHHRGPDAGGIHDEAGADRGRPAGRVRSGLLPSPGHPSRTGDTHATSSPGNPGRFRSCRITISQVCVSLRGERNVPPPPALRLPSS